jgi:hypothetical protein
VISTLRPLGDEIELNGTVVGRLLPNLKLSLRDQLIWIFDAVDEDYVAELEDRVAKLELEIVRLRTPPRGEPQ